MKRHISLILALALLLSTFSVLSVSAAETAADGLNDPAVVDDQGNADDTLAATGTADDGDINEAENSYDFAPPVIKSIVNTTDGVAISWDRADGAEDYEVLRREADADWETIAQTADSAYTDTTVAAGREYTYVLRMIRADASAYMSESSAEESINFVAAPWITSIENTATGALISWTKSAGADYYRVYVQNDNGGWTRLTTTAQTEYTDTSAKDGTACVYTVRCVNKNGDLISGFNSEGWSNAFFAPPVIKSLTNTLDGVTLTWDRADGAQDYCVYRKSGSSSWTRLTKTAASSYTDTGVVSGTTYTYTLRMITADGTPFMSSYNSGKRITFVAAPQITAIENTASGAKISWEKTAGANFYRIYYKNDNGGWTRLASKYLTEYTDTSVKSEKTRVYTVRCLDKNENFVSAFNPDGRSNTFFAPPVIKSITNTFGGVTLKWDRADGAQDYRVYRKTGSSSWTRLTQTAESTYTDATAVSGKTYTYTLRMVAADGKSFISDCNSGKSITYVAAPAISSIENTADGATITWNKVAGADSYRIYYKNDNGSWTRLASKYLTEYTDTSVKNNATRVYTIRCLDKNGAFVSGFDPDGRSNTFFAPPAIKSITYTGGKYTLSWEANDKVAGYRLYRKSLNGAWARVMDATADASYIDHPAADTICAYTLRYLDAEGKTISGFINDAKYYQNGKLCDGSVTYNGTTYFFSKGVLRSGFQRINGKLYCYDTTGKLRTDAIVGSDSKGWYYADEKGVCCESEEFRLAATFMMKYCKGNTRKEKMKYAFMYMANNFPYRRSYDHPKKASDMPALAIDMFKNRSGNCYCYAACYACIARIAGYRARVGVGSTGGMPHGWTEVYVNGKWLICDVDANLPTYPYAPYSAYMMTSHFWQLSKSFSAECKIVDGVAKWV